MPEITEEIAAIVKLAHEDAELPNFQIPIINKSKEKD